MDTPFKNCQFHNCDLVGQCNSEGKCHHPKKLSVELIEYIERLEVALKYIAVDANTGEAGDAFIMRETAQQALASKPNAG